MLQLFERLSSVAPIQLHDFLSTPFLRKVGLSRQLWVGLLDGGAEGIKDGLELGVIDTETDGLEDNFVDGIDE